MLDENVVYFRCGFCVSHEVDSHYCPNCMENMPSAEARLKKNRCANCFDCPHCGHTLSTRATSIAVPSPEDPAKVVAKKVYYLACAFCRWPSRDIGLPDQVRRYIQIFSFKYTCTCKLNICGRAWLAGAGQIRRTCPRRE